ncbi:MAG: hypothetical protein WDZ61_00355 [Parcubacteria group bacterium]
MANVDRPAGLSPVKYTSGAPYNGAANMYLVKTADTTAVFIGDMVDMDGSSGAAGTTVNGVDCEGIASISKAAVAGPAVGVVVGFLPDQDDLSKKHRVASTARIALVADDPGLLFEVQEVSGGTALTADAVGLNANLVDAGGSATTGLSGEELDNTTEAATNGLAVRIVGLSKRPDNVIGEHAKWLVQIMDHRFNSAGPDVGI